MRAGRVTVSRVHAPVQVLASHCRSPVIIVLLCQRHKGSCARYCCYIAQTLQLAVSPCISKACTSARYKACPRCCPRVHVPQCATNNKGLLCSTIPATGAVLLCHRHAGRCAAAVAVAQCCWMQTKHWNDRRATQEYQIFPPLLANRLRMNDGYGSG